MTTIGSLWLDPEDDTEWLAERDGRYLRVGLDERTWRDDVRFALWPGWPDDDRIIARLVRVRMVGK